MSISTKEHAITNRSPSNRSSRSNATQATKRTRNSPLRHDEEIYPGSKKDIMNSLAEQSAFLKQELDKEKSVMEESIKGNFNVEQENINLKKVRAAKLAVMKEDAKVMERRKLDNEEKIKRITRDLQNVDIERFDIQEAIKTKSTKISELISQISKMEADYNLKDFHQNEELMNQYEAQHKYVESLELREKAYREATAEVKKLERECLDNEAELARIQSEIERRMPRIEHMREGNVEAERRLQHQEQEIKDLRGMEVEHQSEMSILMSQKAKILAERETMLHKMDSLRNNTHNILRSLLDFQNSLEAKLSFHLKIWGLRILAILQRRVRSRILGEAVQRIEAYGCSKSCKGGALAKLSGVIETIRRRYKYEVLRRLHEEFLNYPKLSELNEKLLTLKTQRNLVFRSWLAWRQRAGFLQMRREHHYNVLSRMFRALRDSENRVKSIAIGDLKLHATQNETKIMVLHSLLMKKAWKENKKAIAQWRTGTRYQAIETKKEIYGMQLIEVRIKGYFFNRLKDNAEKNRKLKYLVMKQHFEKWQSEFKLRRQYAESRIKVAEFCQMKNRKQAERVFMEWKGVLLKVKDMETEERVLQYTMHYEENIGQLEKFIDVSHNLTRNSAFRMMSILMKKKMSHYFFQWGLNAKKISYTMLTALNVMERAREKSVRQNFKLWKLAAVQVTSHDSKAIREKGERHAKELEKLIHKAAGVENHQSNLNLERNLIVLERIAQRYNKTTVYKAFRKFHTNARTLNINSADYNQGLYMLHKIFVRVFRRQFSINANEHITHKKLTKQHETMNEMRAKRLKRNTLKAFREHVRRFTHARQAIKRFMEVRCDRHVAKKFFVWHSLVKRQGAVEIKQNIDKLETVCYTRTIELERETKSNEHNIKVQKVFEGKVLSARNAHIWNLFLYNIYNLKVAGLNRWRTNVKELAQKSQATVSMVEMLNLHEMRDGFKKAKRYGEKRREFEENRTLQGLVNETEVLNGTIAKEKEKHDKKVEEQKTEIAGLVKYQNKIGDIKEYTIQTIVARIEAEKHLRLCAKVIESWKKRVESHRKSMKVLFKTVNENLLRLGMDTMKEKIKKKLIMEKKRKAIVRLKTRAFKVEKEAVVNRWKLFALGSRRAEILEKFAGLTFGIHTVDEYFERNNESKRELVRIRYVKNTLRTYFDGLVEGIKRMRRLRIAKRRIAEKHLLETKQSFFKQLNLFNIRKKTRRNILNNAVERGNLRLKKSIFGFWKTEIQNMKNFNSVITRCYKNLAAFNKHHAFHKIKQFTRRNQSIGYVEKKEAKKTIMNFVALLVLKIQKQAFLRVVQNLSEKAIVRQRLKELFTRARRRRFAPYFLKWKIKSASRTLYNKASEEGELYQRKLDLERERETLHEYCLKEGYKMHELEVFKAKEEVKKYDLMQKAVSRLIVNASGLTAMTKALHSWKEFVVQRKRVKTMAARIQNYRQKADLVLGLGRWKAWTKSERKQDDVMSKKDLYKTIVMQRNQNYHLEKSIEQITKEVNELDVKVQKEMAELDIGKILAVKTMSKIEDMFKQKYFRILKVMNRKSRNLQKVDESDVTGEKILKLQRVVKSLEFEYKDLFKENSILRATSLEGLDITNAIQELSMEREKLAKELEVKNITIGRLVKENKNLSTRLTGAQREAEELIRFTKEFTTPMKPKREEAAEKDMYKSEGVTKISSTRTGGFNSVRK